MTKSLLFIIMTTGILVGAAVGAELYEKVYDEKTSSGKPLVMTIREIRRDAHTSEFVVSRQSGASVPSAMAVMRACYEVAKLRKAKFFINLKEWESASGNRHYIIGYADDKKPDPLTSFGVEQSTKEPQELKYLAVQDYEPVFGSSKD